VNFLSKKLCHDQIFAFLSLTPIDASRTSTFFKGSQILGVKSYWYVTSPKSIRKDVIKIENQFEGKKIHYIVCSPSHLLVPFILLFTRQKPIFDAGWPLTDGTFISRKEFGLFGLNLLKSIVLDVASVLCAKIVFLESIEQKNRLGKILIFSKSKFRVLPTGFNETRFDDMQATLTKKRKHKIIFRGGDQNEAGLETLIEAIKISKLKNIKFCIVSKSAKFKGLNLKNTLIIDKYLTNDELFNVYNGSTIALGQLSSHKRTNWTIPHKFFEAAYLGIPYLSSDSKVMHKFENYGCVSTFVGGNAYSLIQAIENLLSDQIKLKQLSNNVKELYLKEFSQLKLSKDFIDQTFAV
jgi:glycosyltransferase involved in cell wall biosynthesis